MAFVADQLVSEFIAKTDGYERDVKRATAAIDGHTAAIERNNRAESTAAADASATRTRRTSAEVQASREQASIQKQAAKEVAAEQKAQAKAAAAETKRLAKETAAIQSAAAKEGADAVKIAAREKVAAEKAASAEIAALEKARVAGPYSGQSFGPPRPINIVEPGTGKPQLFGFGNPAQPVSDRPLPVGNANACVMPQPRRRRTSVPRDRKTPSSTPAWLEPVSETRPRRINCLGSTPTLPIWAFRRSIAMNAGA